MLGFRSGVSFKPIPKWDPHLKTVKLLTLLPSWLENTSFGAFQTCLSFHVLKSGQSEKTPSKTNRFGWKCPVYPFHGFSPSESEQEPLSPKKDVAEANFNFGFGFEPFCFCS